MDKTEAKEALRLYRPGLNDHADPRVAEALRLAQEDAELAVWFETHCRFQIAMQAKLKAIPVPADLKHKILRADAERRGRVVYLRNAMVPLAAAAVLILLGLGAWSFFSRSRGDVFAAGRERIVKDAQGGYQMSMTSTNLAEIHDFLVAKNYPDYSLTKALAQLDGQGCATNQWHNRKIAMVCLYARKDGQRFLFVMDRGDLKNTPEPGKTEFAQVYRWMTASWTDAGKVYILAGPGSESDLKMYLN